MNQLLTRDEVSALVKCSKPTLYKWMRTCGFPKPIRLGLRAVRWHESDVREWLAHRPEGGEPEQPAA